MFQVKLQKDYIYEHVSLITSVLSRAGDKYTAAAVTPDNYPALDRLMEAAVTEAEARLHRYITCSRNTSLVYDANDVIINLDDVQLKHSVRGTIASQLRLAMAYMLCCQWMLTFDNEISASYASSSESYLQAVADMLNQHDPTADISNAPVAPVSDKRISVSSAASGSITDPIADKTIPVSSNLSGAAENPLGDNLRMVNIPRCHPSRCHYIPKDGDVIITDNIN